MQRSFPRGKARQGDLAAQGNSEGSDPGRLRRQDSGLLSVPVTQFCFLMICWNVLYNSACKKACLPKLEITLFQ